mgnify:CR=1 FL=1
MVFKLVPLQIVEGGEGFDGRLQLYDGASGRLTRALSGTTPRQKWNDVCAAPALGGNLILATALVPDSADDTGGYRVDVLDVRKAQPTVASFFAAEAGGLSANVAARCSAGWQNGTNSACCFAAGMPTPLSRTSKVIRARRGTAKSKKN